MKVILQLILSVLVLFSCTDNDIKKAIEANILLNADGVEMNPKINEVIDVQTFSVKDAITGMKLWFHDEEVMKMDGEELKALLEKRADDASDAKYEKHHRQAAERLETYLRMPEDETAYKIYKAKYTIENPILNGATQHITHIYFINYKNEVLFDTSYKEWKEIIQDDDLPGGPELTELLLRSRFQ